MISTFKNKDTEIYMQVLTFTAKPHPIVLASLLILFFTMAARFIGMHNLEASWSKM